MNLKDKLLSTILSGERVSGVRGNDTRNQVTESELSVEEGPSPRVVRGTDP